MQDRQGLHALALTLPLVAAYLPSMQSLQIKDEFAPCAEENFPARFECCKESDYDASLLHADFLHPVQPKMRVHPKRCGNLSMFAC